MKNKPKVLIVEDEPLIADNIAFILEDNGYQVIGKAIDTAETIENLEQDRPDIILLDISLEDNDEDGIELAHIINNDYHIPFVFITSYSDQLTINRVKKTNPCGFIIKPFKAIEILSTISIALYKYKQRSTRENREMEDSFFVKQGHDLVKVFYNDILYIKAEDNYSAIILASKKILASSNLKALNRELPTRQFIRIHRSYMINLSKISRISHRFVYIDNIEIPIGRGYFQELLKMINIFSTNRSPF